MARGITSRDQSLDQLLRSLYERIRRLERPTRIQLGGTTDGWTITVDVDGNLVAVSAQGNRVILGTQLP